MYTFVLQDWLSVSITGQPSDVTYLTQRAAEYLDATQMADAVFYIEVAEASGGPQLQLQTSPTRDDTLFASMVIFAMSSGVGLTTIEQVMLATAPPVPVGKWIRWRLKADAATNPTATFRITAALGTGR